MTMPIYIDAIEDCKDEIMLSHVHAPKGQGLDQFEVNLLLERMQETNPTEDWHLTTKEENEALARSEWDRYWNWVVDNQLNSY